MQALLVYNPKAGRFNAEEIIQRTCARLQSHGWDVVARASETRDHLHELATDAARRSLDAVIVAGGDGSIGTAASGLLHSRTALAVIPTGTANVWAKELCLPRLRSSRDPAVDVLADLIASSRPIQVDASACNENPFLLWAGLGIDAHTATRAERTRSHLKKRLAIPEYAFWVVKSSLRYPGFHGQIKIALENGDHLELSGGPYVLAVASCIPGYAGGLVKIAPHAKLDDGLIELCLFRGRGLAATLHHAWNLLSESHVRDNEVKHVAFRECWIQLERPDSWHTDGEVHEASDRLHIRVLPGALTLLKPEITPAHLFSR